MKNAVTGRSAKSIFIYLVLSSGIILSLLIFFYVYKMEQKYVRNEFNIIASDRARVIIDGLSDNLAMLRSVEYLYASSKSVERDEFREFVKHMLDAHPEIYEFRWLPRVSGSERQAFETAVSAEGLGEFYIKDRDENDKLVRATARDEYFPIYYIEPWDKAGKAWGIDSFAIPSRWNMMQKARDTGEPALAAELSLVGEPKFKSATRIFLPVYLNNAPHSTPEERRKNIHGFLVILFNMETMADVLLKDMRGRGIDTYIYDETLYPGDRLVCFDYSRTRGKRIEPIFGEEQLKGVTGIAWKGSFTVAGSRITIVCRPAPAFFKKYRMLQPWFVLAISLFIAIMLTLYLLNIKRRTAVIEAIVKQKTGELERAQAQLMQSAKMASIGLLAGGVAHEINNPLTGVLNNVQLIKMMAAQKKECSPEEFSSLLAAIEESALRCRDITRALLDFSRVSRGHAGNLSLNNIIEQVLTVINNELRLRNIAVHKELQEGLPVIPGDAQLLQQMIVNLVDNSRWAIQKKNSGGGNITVKTIYTAGNQDIELSVTDNGIGIARENISRIFEPFFTTKDIGEGTGLGLAFVYNIVESHKGSIEVESEPGKGTALKIKLPITQAIVC